MGAERYSLRRVLAGRRRRRRPPQPRQPRSATPLPRCRHSASRLSSTPTWACRRVRGRGGGACARGGCRQLWCRGAAPPRPLACACALLPTLPLSHPPSRPPTLSRRVPRLRALSGALRGRGPPPRPLCPAQGERAALSFLPCGPCPPASLPLPCHAMPLPPLCPIPPSAPVLPTPTLPHTNTHTLQARGRELGVADVQLRLAPLEEVFLAVARRAELEHAQVCMCMCGGGVWGGGASAPSLRAGRHTRNRTRACPCPTPLTHAAGGPRRDAGAGGGGHRHQGAAGSRAGAVTG